ncbi:MAG TPA: DegT/DnrJ/EryC1/StrS family aminotransferase [Dehalococcoidales bacterium]|nr:MAG: cell wall biogenesis protein [Chloroflexi bacterium RBG_16_60_22]HJX13217.1 DegT/DnrJ/EryC1/StrS family aminotransferase [Dehalococcoidales bacterium]
MRDIPFGKPIIGDEERQAVGRVLAGTTLTHGPLVKEFEAVFARYTGAGYAVAVSSCTAALHLAYFYLGVGPGDEVIVPAETHVATAHAVELVGARPVFVDSEKVTGNIDIDRIEAAISPKTRAISVVHYLGMPVDMRRVVKIARKYKLFVVEDCALALGTYLGGVHAGLLGDVGCFSFYPVKHITTAEGGMVVTGIKDIAEKISRQRAFGIDRNIVSERPVPGVYDVVELGLNYRLNEIGAALGIAQMKRLDGFLEKRRENYAALTDGLQGIDGIELLRSSHDEYRSSCYCQAAILEDSLAGKRFEIVRYLKERGVGTSVYYPHPVPHLEYYKRKYGYNASSFPVAARISGSSIALPVGPHVGREDIDYMVKTVKEAIEEVSRNE